MDYSLKSNPLKRLKCSKEYSQVKKSIDALLSLLSSAKLLAEFELLRKMTPKIAVRLRNSPYSRSLEQLLRTVTSFQNQSDFKIGEHKQFFESDTSEINNVKSRISAFLDQTETFGQLVSKMVFHSSKAYKIRLAQRWLDLGQLINHFLVVCCITSRICVIAKAILVYVYDVYVVELQFANSCGFEQPDKLQSCLLKHDIKLRKSNSSSQVKNIIQEEKKSGLQTNQQQQPSSTKVSSICNSLLISEELPSDTDEPVDLGVALDRKKFMQTTSLEHCSNKKSRKRKKKQAAATGGGGTAKKTRVLQSSINEVVQTHQTTAAKRKRKHKNVNQFQVELTE